MFFNQQESLDNIILKKARAYLNEVKQKESFVSISFSNAIRQFNNLNSQSNLANNQTHQMLLSIKSVLEDVLNSMQNYLESDKKHLELLNKVDPKNLSKPQNYELELLKGEFEYWLGMHNSGCINVKNNVEMVKAYINEHNQVNNSIEISSIKSF